MRQKTRRTIVFISLLLFPVTLNYFSPYISVDGAFLGIVSGSVIIFLIMFLSGFVFKRAWYAWICPVAGLSELCRTINDKPVPARKHVLRYRFRR